MFQSEILSRAGPSKQDILEEGEAESTVVSAYTEKGRFDAFKAIGETGSLKSGEKEERGEVRNATLTYVM
jgi:hypothetical protein